MGTYCGRQAFIMGQLRLVMEERSGYHLERQMIGRSVVQDGETDRLHLNTEPAAQGSGYQVYADHLAAVLSLLMVTDCLTLHLLLWGGLLPGYLRVQFARLYRHCSY